MSVSAKLIGVWKDYAILLSNGTISVCDRKDIKKVISKVSLSEEVNVKFSDQQITEVNSITSLILLKDDGILICIPPFLPCFVLIVPEKYKYIYTLYSFDIIKRINIKGYLQLCSEVGDISEEISDCISRNSDEKFNIMFDILHKNMSTVPGDILRTFISGMSSSISCGEKIELEEPQAITYLRNANDYCMTNYIISDGKWTKLCFSDTTRLFQVGECALTDVRYVILIESTLTHTNNGIQKTKKMTVNIYNLDSQMYLGSFLMEKAKCSKVAIYGPKFILSASVSGRIYIADISIIIEQSGIPMWDQMITERLFTIEIEKVSMPNHYIDSEYTSWLCDETLYSAKHKL